MSSYLTSRFVKNSDPHDGHFVFDMPRAWWSRWHEYEWAKQLCQPDDISLDAACGVEHPLKFYLLDHGKQTHACDLDHRILSGDTMRAAADHAYGVSAKQNFPDRYIHDIHYELASLTDLPYQDRTFDRIYCISVLEHLKGGFNKLSWLPRISPFSSLLRKDIENIISGVPAYA